MILSLLPPVLQFQLPALLFVCILFVLLLFFCSWFVGSTKAEPRARVGRPQTSSSPPVIFIAGRPKTMWRVVIYGYSRYI